MVDPCVTATYHPVLGTLTASASANVQQSVTAPTGLVNLATVGGQVYGLFSDSTIRALGTFPNLTAGATLANVTTPADRTAFVFLSNYLAKSGTLLLAGYTKLGMTIPGSVALVETADAGVSYVDAPGNYSAAGFPAGFAVNGTGLGARSGQAVWLLNPTDGGVSPLAAFDGGWQAASGPSSVTSSSVLLLGYFHGTLFQNFVRAAPPLQYTPAVQSGLPFALSDSVEVAGGFDLIDIGAFGPDALAVRGGFRMNYDSFASRLERIPLTVAGTSVTVGAPVTLLSATDECTGIPFTSPAGADVLIGVKDKNGLRVVRLAP